MHTSVPQSHLPRHMTGIVWRCCLLRSAAVYACSPHSPAVRRYGWVQAHAAVACCVRLPASRSRSSRSRSRRASRSACSAAPPGGGTSPRCSAAAMSSFARCRRSTCEGREGTANSQLRGCDAACAAMSSALQHLHPRATRKVTGRAGAARPQPQGHRCSSPSKLCSSEP